MGPSLWSAVPRVAVFILLAWAFLAAEPELLRR